MLRGAACEYECAHMYAGLHAHLCAETREKQNDRKFQKYREFLA